MVNTESQTVDVVTAGRILGVARNTAYQLVRDGAIPHLRLRGRIRIPLAALEEMLQHPDRFKAGMGDSR